MSLSFFFSLSVWWFDVKSDACTEPWHGCFWQSFCKHVEAIKTIMRFALCFLHQECVTLFFSPFFHFFFSVVLLLFFMHAVFPNQGLSSHSFLEFNSIPFRFLLLFSDCFVFEKWLSHHFYCIFGVYDSQWSVMCVCVLGVCHKDLCVAIYTHAKTHTDKSKVKRLFDAYIEWNVASGMRQVASGKASNVNG